MTKIYFDSRKCLSCHSCELACAIEHSVSKDAVTAHLEEPVPVRRRNVMLAGIPDRNESCACITVACRHCVPAQCIEACISSAMERGADGYVYCDEKKCVSCWMCVMVCPFGAVAPGTRASVKCDMCPEREGFACVDACPTKALFAMTGEEYSALCEEKASEACGGTR
jgi:carbon-monoxide dehydrogenase iron sulfur subunit